VALGQKKVATAGGCSPAVPAGTRQRACGIPHPVRRFGRHPFPAHGPATPQQDRNSIMAKVCQVTGKGPMVGNNVSHANNKTKRRFLPNLQQRRLWVESEQRYVRLRVTAAGLRKIDKLGVEAVLAEINAAKA